MFKQPILETMEIEPNTSNNNSNYSKVSVYSFFLNVYFISFIIFFPFYLVKVAFFTSFQTNLFAVSTSSLKYLLIGSFLNFSYNLFSFKVLDQVSPTTHSVINIMKRMFVVFGSILFFYSKLSYIQYFGVFLADAGCLLYSYFKTKSPKNKVQVSERIQMIVKRLIVLILIIAFIFCMIIENGKEKSFGKKKSIKLYYKPDTNKGFDNFEDLLSYELVKRIVGPNLETTVQYNKTNERKLFAIGSALNFASNEDVIWGSGFMTDKLLNLSCKINVKAVRGPKTRQLMMKICPNINVPEVYGDAVLLVPYLFTEFQRKQNPIYDYTILPYLNDINYSPFLLNNISGIQQTEKWNLVVKRIIRSKLVISSSLFGIILAESFGIPARMLKLKEDQNIFIFTDYFYGTGRFNYKYATSIDDAKKMGGEPPIKCDLKKFYDAFPREFFSHDIRKLKLPLGKGI